MWPNSYFGGAYFAARYWPKSGAGGVTTWPGYIAPFGYF